MPDVSCRKSLQSGKGVLQIGCEPLDNSLAPALGALALDDGPADVPVQGDEFTVDGERGLDLRRPDARLQVFEQFALADRAISGGCRPRD